MRGGSPPTAGGARREHVRERLLDLDDVGILGPALLLEISDLQLPAPLAVADGWTYGCHI
jgi:hypothetical protein